MRELEPRSSHNPTESHAVVGDGSIHQESFGWLQVLANPKTVPIIYAGAHGGALPQELGLHTLDCIQKNIVGRVV